MTQSTVYLGKCSIYTGKGSVQLPLLAGVFYNWQDKTGWILFSSVLIIIERDVEISDYNCGFISSFSSVSFCFMYFEAPLVGAQPLELAYLLEKLITSLLESNTLYPS